MIDLLKQFAAAAEGAVIGGAGEGARALRLLEWRRVTEQIAAHCRNRLAGDAVRERLPFDRLEPIAMVRTLIDELRPRGADRQWPPVVDISDALAALATAAPLHLDPVQLVAAAAAAESLDALRNELLRRQQAMPTWSTAATQMEPLAALATAIRRALDRDGRLRDDATPLLARLRRACGRQERSVRQSVDRAMAAARRSGWTTGPEATLRGDRFCLPLRAGSSRRIDGIVHDRSASGGTLFVEPAEVVGLHNALVELRLEAASEEARILHELNRRLEENRPAFRASGELMLLVDEIIAALQWSESVGGQRPVLAEAASLRICAGRHPLLIAQEQRRTSEGFPGRVVPLDLELADGVRVVVISGPNAGGKTVALKTVGLFCLLAQCGWDVPAREDTQLPLIRRLFVDLGDEQSIEQSLSSFSAHLAHLGRFLRDADDATLVLCDEIGSGTDPEEGTALAFSMLEGLAQRGATVLASTHFGLLKAAVHDHAAMVNAGTEYDEESLRPLFTLRLGVPGASHAFDIAGRLGFSERLLARARELVGEKRFQIERLLGELGHRARELAQRQGEAETAAAAAQRLRGELEERLAQIESERRELLAAARQQGEHLVAEGRRTIEAAVREIRESAASRTTIRRAHGALEKLATGLNDSVDRGDHPPAEPPLARELQAGDRVRIPHLGFTGTVVEARGEKVTALAAGLRLTIARSSVELLPPADEDAAAAGDNRIDEASWSWHDSPPEVAHEVDLRGLRGEEAWEKLDQLIDRAIPAGLREIRVIHGVGTGRLRETLLERLARDERLSGVRPANHRRGGFGVTVIHLADD